MYGTQTVTTGIAVRREFENDVKMYGTQTFSVTPCPLCPFENDVKMYGTQTPPSRRESLNRLRMM